MKHSLTFFFLIFFGHALLAADVAISPESHGAGEFSVLVSGATAKQVWNFLLEKNAKASLEWRHRSYRGDRSDTCEITLQTDSTTCTITHTEEDNGRAYFEFGYKDKGFCGTADLLAEIRISRLDHSASVKLTLAEVELLTERLDRERHPDVSCRMRVR